MASVPLRFRLLYDPLFLDLSRRLRAGLIGKVIGVSASAVVASADDLVQTAAFLFLFFGIPKESKVQADRAASLGRLICFYDSFALSLDASFVPGAVPPSAGIALTGFVQGDSGLAEYRFGAERLSAYSPREGESYRLAVPEGDGAYYRDLDMNDPGGPRVVSVESDCSALERAARCIGNQFASFPGCRP